MTRGSREKTFGLIDDAAKVRGELRPSKAPGVVAPTGPFAVLDMYASGEIRVHLHAVVVGWVDDRREVCAVYQVRNGVDPFNIHALTKSIDAVRPVEPMP